MALSKPGPPLPGRRAGRKILQQAARTHAAYFRCPHRFISEEPGKHEIDSVEFRAAGAAGQDDGGHRADLAEA